MKRTASRYGVNRVEWGGIMFDSRRELIRWQELRLMERAGLITELQRQIAYELAPAVQFAGEKRKKPALRYVVDFQYLEHGRMVCEDVKGVQTEVFRIKRHLMLSVHRIDVRVTR